MSQEQNLIIINKQNEQDQYYKTINLTSLLDNNLSFKAKGLHNYIMTRPDNWKLWMQSLFNLSTDGETSVRSAINELIQNKYLYRFAIRDEKKRIKKWAYIASSIPTNKEDLNLDNLDIENLDIENQTYSKKNNSNNINSQKKEQAIINDSKRGSRTPQEKSLDKKQSEYDSRSEKIIKWWSSLGYTTDHTKNPESKTYLRIVKKLSLLQKGTFWRIGPFDPEWIKEKEIPETWFKQAWTYPELRDNLILASRYSLDGYFPDDKTFCKSLDNILYHIPRKKDAGTSWLFNAMKNPPIPEKQTYQKIPLEKTTQKLMKNPIWPKGYQFDQYKLGKGLTELKYFADNLIRDQYNRSHQYFDTLAKLLKEYLAWIDEQDWIDYMRDTLIGTDNKVFRLFIEAQEKEIGLKIKSKGWK